MNTVPPKPLVVGLYEARPNSMFPVTKTLDTYNFLTSWRCLRAHGQEISRHSGPLLLRRIF